VEPYSTNSPSAEQSTDFAILGEVSEVRQHLSDGFKDLLTLYGGLLLR